MVLQFHNKQLFCIQLCVSLKTEYKQWKDVRSCQCFIVLQNCVSVFCLCSSMCVCVCVRVLSHTTLLDATGFLAFQHTQVSFLSCLKLLRGWCVRDEMNKNHLDAAEVYRQHYKRREAGRTAQQQGFVHKQTLYLAFYNRKNKERAIL